MKYSKTDDKRIGKSYNVKDDEVGVTGRSETEKLIQPKYECNCNSSRDIRVSNDYDNGRSANQPLRVLLMAAYRTGSTFTAELFNRNNEFFYVFEPGRLLTSCMIQSGAPECLFKVRHVEMLEKMFRCQFDNMECYIDTFANLSIAGQWREMRMATNELCRRKVNEKMQCQPPSPTLLHEICGRKKHIAIKTIRIRQITDVIHLTREEDLNLKVVQIIRDPRGRMSSWLNLKNGTKTIYSVEDIDQSALATTNTYCQRWLENYVIGRSLTDTDFYSLVRYEDMAEHPQPTAERLYRYIGLELPTGVRKWLDENTRQQKGRKDPYGTSRNSKEQAQGWRGTLTFEAARLVESLKPCKQLMNAFGYKSAVNEVSYSDRNHSLVAEIPDFDPGLYDQTWRFV
ncbi:carbohydrate sulfotransferase 3-like [Glandiceps talaboti]